MCVYIYIYIYIFAILTYDHITISSYRPDDVALVGAAELVKRDLAGAPVGSAQVKGKGRQGVVSKHRNSSQKEPIALSSYALTCVALTPDVRLVEDVVQLLHRVSPDEGLALLTIIYYVRR